MTTINQEHQNEWTHPKCGECDEEMMLDSSEPYCQSCADREEEYGWVNGIIPNCEKCGKKFAEDGHNYNERDGDEICDDCEEEYCECNFPKFIIDDGIQSCSRCGKNDHYKCGVVADHSEEETIECDGCENMRYMGKICVDCEE